MHYYYKGETMRRGIGKWSRRTASFRLCRRFAWSLAAVMALVASGSLPQPAAQAASSTLVIADLAPFTGADGSLGPIYLASCYAAVQEINAAGGVLGHHFACSSSDTRGDPADAVPATRKLLATTSNLALVIGVTSDEAATVVPILNASKVPVFGMTGQSEFDHKKFPYFFRLVAPDLEESYAMVAIAKEKHYKKIALAFGNDIGSQTFVSPAVASIRKAKMTLVANETLDLNATTFRTEAQAIVSAHPDVVFTEALGPADASLLSEIKQLNGGKMIPVIGTSATIDPTWFSTVSAAIGASTLASNYVADNQSVETSGPAYNVYSRALLAQRGKVSSIGNLTTILTAPGAVHLYDGMNLAALAMIESKSTNPSVFKSDIIKIGNGVRGAKVVTSFAQGVAALKAGKAIRYEGPGGATNFDAYHDSVGIFQIDRYSANGSVQVVGNISAAQLRANA